MCHVHLCLLEYGPLQDILTVTFNPAVDMSTATPEVSAGPKLRCDAPVFSAGGGGINVSRAIRILGGYSRAFVAAGGTAGVKLGVLLAEEGIARIPYPAPGETRTNVAVIEGASGDQYRYVMPGPTWREADCELMLDNLCAMVSPSGLVVLSGSLAPGMPVDVIRRIMQRLGAEGPKVICDISGAPLADLCGHEGCGLEVLRMDHDEAEEIEGAPLASREDSARFARDLVTKGVARAVVVARGPDGSVLATETGCVHASGLDVPVDNKVGAGDSFVGAFALAMAMGKDATTALQWGTTAATSAVTTPARELCRKPDFERYLPECALSDLAV